MNSQPSHSDRRDQFMCPAQRFWSVQAPSRLPPLSLLWLSFSSVYPSFLGQQNTSWLGRRHLFFDLSFQLNSLNVLFRSLAHLLDFVQVVKVLVCTLLEFTEFSFTFANKTFSFIGKTPRRFLSAFNRSWSHFSLWKLAQNAFSVTKLATWRSLCPLRTLTFLQLT